jgi:AraC-like DNA-binding protein
MCSAWRAVAVLRAEFAKSLPVERLAAAAGMSPSSFHPHFRAVTSLSPLQFQKQLRLIEARRLMMSGRQIGEQRCLCGWLRERVAVHAGIWPNVRPAARQGH